MGAGAVELLSPAQPAKGKGLLLADVVELVRANILNSKRLLSLNSNFSRLPQLRCLLYYVNYQGLQDEEISVFM